MFCCCYAKVDRDYRLSGPGRWNVVELADDGLELAGSSRVSGLIEDRCCYISGLAASLTVPFFHNFHHRTW